MSEKDKIRREDYRRRRKRWILAIALLLALAAVSALLLFAVYHHLNKTTYIPYTENGEVNYKVKLLPNDFYDKEYLGQGQAYVASLIESISADFNYALDMDTADVDYRYSYRVESQLLVKDRTGDLLYSPTQINKEEKTFRQSSNKTLSIKESVTIDYPGYNALAEEFIKTYQLTGATSTLAVRLHVSVIGSSASFAQDTANDYVVAMEIPLTTQTLNINISTSVPSTESRVLAHNPAEEQQIYLLASLACAVLTLLLVITLILFVYLTRNTDINYSIKVKRLVNAYKSYIQQILNPFDTAHYQVLSVKTFPEMLDIRDTIQSPILMHENEDRTCTQFIIPTNNGILYCFEIKVDNYDELYGTQGEPEQDVPDTSTEQAPLSEQAIAAMASIAEQELAQTAIEENTAPPVSEAAPAKEETVDDLPAALLSDVEIEQGFALGGPKLDYSFEAKLALCDDEVRSYYSRIISFARSFGVKVARSWPRERIYLGRNLFALMVFKGKKLAIALALDPATHGDPKYHAYDMSGSRKYQKTPMLMRITSARKVKYATELLTELFTAAGLENQNLGIEEPIPAFRSKPTLYHAGLIRVEGEGEHSIMSSVPEPARVEAEPAPEIAEEIVQELPETVDIPEQADDEGKSGFALNGPKLDYSFEAKLALSTKEVREYYAQITDFARSFGVKVARSWPRERIYLGRNLFALLVFKGKKLSIALALDPATHNDPKYHAYDMSGSRKFQKTPLLIRITSARKVKYATELLTELFTAAGLENKHLNLPATKVPTATKKALLEAGLIRIEGAQDKT